LVEDERDPLVEAAGHPLRCLLPQALAVWVDGHAEDDRVGLVAAAERVPRRPELPAKLVPRPPAEDRAVEPDLLLLLPERRELGVVLEAQGVPPAGHGELPRDPRVVPERLVVERGGLDRALVAVAVPVL